ncbi:MAG: formate--tetrahydrofolate ligase [bacterium]|nr:formate--tetrahydrofolate ligase [bacterium]
MKSDIEISRETPLKPISEIAKNLNIPEDEVMHYGKYKAKISLSQINENAIQKSNLILVTAISPTKAGVGKTVTSVSLSLGLNKIGKKSIVALREPSLGPVFGMKGGAAGGGYAQVLPMEDINLHFTGDFHAITSANNTIAALLDNYQYNHINSEKALKQIVWKRVLDVNDRSLRYVNTGLGGRLNGLPQETGFDITPASEIMAILCLSENLEDLKGRINRIVLGYKIDNTPFTVSDLGIADAIVILLKDALMPNLVQTTENTPAIIHGGPFANIAHGCNSILATKMALSLSDYVVTEAGFGSDLGAEKFLDIKCRIANLQPKATVLVVTTQALKNHADLTDDEAKKPNLEVLKRGLPNLERHIENLQSFGQSIIVSLNKFYFDVQEEIDFLSTWCEERKATFAINDAFVNGGEGASDLAKAVVEVIEKNPSKAIQYQYELTDDVVTKIRKVATQIYRATDIELSHKARTALAKITKNNWQHLPICIAKTQYSFTDNPKITGAPSGHTITIEDLIINAGAGFVVAVAGDIMRMPGLPKVPAAYGMTIKDGLIEGLS